MLVEQRRRSGEAAAGRWWSCGAVASSAAKERIMVWSRVMMRLWNSARPPFKGP